MRIGVPREIKEQEYRVGAVPAGVQALVRHGHKVLVQSGAGGGSKIGDDAYRAAGAMVIAGAEAVYGESYMIIKVKEPQPRELKYMRRNQILFTFLHLAG